MADESELRSMLQREAAGAGTPELDPGRLVRRSRARRLPRQLAAGGALTLAVLGLGAGAVTGIRLLAPAPETSSAGGSAESADEPPAQDDAVDTLGDDSAGDAAGGGASELAPAYKINGCGGMLAAASDPELTGIAVEVDFPAEARAGQAVTGSVELTNTGEEPLSGQLDAVAATTLADDGLVLWHTPRVEESVPLELAPGESTTLTAAFEPLVCAPEDEGLQDFRPDLPRVEPGVYEVSVAFDIVRLDGPTVQVVSGAEPITLH
jgi:hypothetical protein